MKLITVFTPTFNRAHTLHKCYESLIKQRSKNFVWQIIDDGSTDNTKKLVEKWCQDALIEIDYHYKENGGKASAINVSTAITKTLLWVCLDSDDYLTDDCIEIIEHKYKFIKNNNSICGLFSLRCNKNLEPMHGKELPIKLKVATQEEVRYIYKIQPEYMQVYKTSIIKNYKYPVFKDEKFFPLSYIQDQIDKKYKFLLIRKPMMICEYIQDGITMNHTRLVIKNPKGYTLFRKQQITLGITLLLRLKANIAYCAGCILSNNKNCFKDSPNKFMTIISYPFGYLLYKIKYRQ